MKTAIAKKEIASILGDRVGRVFERREKPPVEILPTRIAKIDEQLQGFPRGAITEIYGAASSGRTSLLLSALAFATSHEETCALVECRDTFDLSAASKAGISFDRLLWVRCGDRLERAFKAVDLLLHAGGFGFVALNLCDVPAKSVRRIISTWWFRFRRSIENTPTVLIVLTPVAAVRSCAALVLELKNERAVWRTLSLVSENRNGNFTDRRVGSQLSLVSTSHAAANSQVELSHSHFLQGMQIQVNRERPVEWHPDQVKFHPRRS